MKGRNRPFQPWRVLFSLSIDMENMIHVEVFGREDTDGREQPRGNLIAGGAN